MTKRQFGGIEPIEEKSLYGGDTPGGFSTKGDVLLREVEYCRECGGSFLSLYPIKNCDEHEEEDRV